MKIRDNYLPLSSYFSFCISFILLLALCAAPSFAQPLNDNCNNATAISIGTNGYGTGVFYSDTVNITAATVQTGETVPPPIFVAGQYYKSVWYTFTIGTSRKLQVTLNQPGIGIAAGDVGFTVYKASSCLPGNAQISNKLTPMETFGSTFHPCVDSGVYMIQITAKQNANGPVFLKLNVDPVAAPYDDREQAFMFGVMNQSRKSVIYDVDCLSKESAQETCLGNPVITNQYTKTTWHTFTTPAYFDYITMLVAAGNTPYFTNVSTQHIIGYKLYEGNAQITPLASLVLVDGCDTFKTNGFRPSYRTYRCGQLDPNKTYSLQLFFRSDFIASVRVGLFKEGVAPSKGPVPTLSAIQPDNQLGILPFGLTARTDYFACNGRHITNPCGNSKPQGGVIRNNIRYNLSTYFTFSLAEASNVVIGAYNVPGMPPVRPKYIRVFYNGLTNNCTDLDTLTVTNRIYRFDLPGLMVNTSSDSIFRCLPAGNYTIQVLGSEDSLLVLNQQDVSNSTAPSRMYGELGLPFNLRVTVSYMLDNNNFPLFQAGAYDKINNMVPLALNNTYNAIQDTFGCSNAVLPSSFGCAADYKKAMYREFVLSDSMVVTFGGLGDAFFDTNMVQNYRYQLYKGDANALALAQNMWTSPNTFSGLNAISDCFTKPPINSPPMRTCLVPGTYTLATYGNKSFVNKTDKPGFTTSTYTTLHYSQATVGNMGSVLDSLAASANNTYSSPMDYFSCRNNAITIAGVAPCGGASKAIYREFYLGQPAAVNITSNNSFSLFTGRLSTVGFAGLAPYLTCSFGVYQPICGPPIQIFPAGWYTVVSYGAGPGYDVPAPNGSIWGAQLGGPSLVHISFPVVCNPPQHNRPYKAAVTPVTNTPILVQWNAASAATAYPQSSNNLVLPTEYWNCTPDTPFSSHPIVSCSAYENKVAYYVFQLTQECFLDINPVGASSMKLYKRDVRIDSLLFPTLTPIVPCSVFGVSQQICKAQPGVYTLVVFGSGSCSAVMPQIYVDRADEQSRFDHAKNAYDFGTVPANNTYYNGKVGDVNPLNSARAPSNDFFYCSTGSRSSDPADAVCAAIYNATIYNTPDTNNLITNGYNASRRNLWYTFQVTKPGNIKVKVDNKTPNKMSQYNFAVYRSDVNGGLPFTQVVSTGQVDSTIAQGLTFIARNSPYNYCEGVNEISFDVPACNFDTFRYYVIVDNTYVPTSTTEFMRPNHQAEVSVRINPVPAVFTDHDYYATVSDMGTIGVGNHVGALDYYVCATANSNYPMPMPTCAQRTLWYKFTVGAGIVGTAKIRLLINGTNYFAGADDMRLMREIVPGDSTVTGMEQTHLSSIPNYQQGCVSPGTYYLVLTGCGMTSQSVTPEVLLEQNVGDYCGAPLVTTLNGAGASSATALIDCHTIGTDYGEMGQTISCPVNGVTEQYKSTWFRIDVGGNDTLDLSIAMTENTNVSASQIHYRMMTGNCSAMQEQSCVQDVLTQNTYQCLVPGQSYFIQVFTPISYFNGDPAYPTMGSLTLNVSAVDHVDTCQPMNNCLVNANFIPTFDCNVNDSVFFNNYSTYGSAIQYLWDFGYNNQTSAAVSPAFMYPALSTAATYTVSLRAINTDCIDTSFSVQTITIPARPVVNLGNDTFSCTYGQAFTLHATSYPGSAYLWQNGSADSVFTANLSGNHTYSVFVTYGGCTDYDAIDIYISPLIAQGPDTILLCDNQTFVTPDATRPFAGTTYLWNTSATTPVINAGTPGVYWADVTLNGCTVRDSFVVQYNLDTFSVLGNDTAICHFANGYVLNGTAAGASAYLWQDNSTAQTFTLHNPGTYWVRATFNGCAYTDSIHITSLPLAASHVYDTVCFGGYHVLPLGDTAFSSGLYQDTVAVPAHCDSVINTHLYVRDSIYAIAYDTVCANQLPIVWNGITVNGGGANAASFVSTGSLGCDSTASLFLVVLPNVTTTFNQQVCVYILPYNFYGNSISTSGTYYHTLQGYHGCDSFLVMNLSVVTEYRDTITSQICAGGSMPFYDSVYHNSGYYTHSFPSNSGCDSFKTLHLIVSPVTPPPVVVSPVSYCRGDVAMPLTATGANLLWYSSATGGTGSTTAPVPATGSAGEQLYYVSQTLNNCESERDTIRVIISDKPQADFTVVPNDIMCSADSVSATFIGIQPAGSVQVWQWDQGQVYGAAPGPYQVQWNTGGTKTIKLWLDNAGCISDTVVKNIVIKPTPENPVMILPDYVCVHDTISVYAETMSSNAALHWQYNGSPINEGISFPMSWPEPGMHYFSLYLTEDGCTSKTAMDSILVVDLPVAGIQADSGKLCSGDMLKMRTEAINGAEYTWWPADYFPGQNQDVSAEVNARVGIAGWIHLRVTNVFGCENFDSLYVNPEYCCNVFIPNAFTPNGDGRNDVFKVETEATQDVKEFAIYNRYGQRVFLSQSQDKGWDGTQNGNKADLGTYHYYIKYVCSDGSTHVKKGDVTLMR